MKEKPKIGSKNGMKNLKIVLDTFPITSNGIFHCETVGNTLFYNNNMRYLTICDRFLSFSRKTQILPTNLALKMFKSRCIPILSFIEEIMIVNQCGISYSLIKPQKKPL